MTGILWSLQNVLGKGDVSSIVLFTWRNDFKAMPKDGNDWEPMQWDGEKIRALRQRLGLTQEELGLRLFDYPPTSARTAVSRLERSEVNPSAAARKMLERLEQEAGKEG